jgi:uncharacterized membrane protein YgdD (TMEM256/DUF423 family)
MSHRELLLTAGLLGMTGVLSGALGAHALHESLVARQMVGVWQTAVSYHLIHSVALLALVGGKVDAGKQMPKLAAAAARCWIGGVILFSGSLYALALGAPPALGPITPLGGLLLLAGWTLVIAMGWRPPPGPPSA